MQVTYDCKFCGNRTETNPAECYTTRARDRCPHWLSKQQETVSHPAHYGGDTVYETIKVLRAWMTPEQYEGFLVGNSIKYLSRYRMKGGTEVFNFAKL